MSTPPASSVRDPRVDLLRGISLLSIFVDHIPDNRLADFTLHSFGFSDAAELFVILAGYSATFAYNRVFERDGLRVGLTKVLLRCLQIYGVQVVLLLSTLAFVATWDQYYGRESVIVGPMLRDGLSGAMRGVSLQALPAYLDILPLYLVLLGAFPLIRFGMARSVAATLALSALLWGVANVAHWNLPNVVDPSDAAHWYFNPLTWQVVFVAGCFFAHAARSGWHAVIAPPAALLAACWIYVVAALWIVDAWKLWPSPFGAGFSSTSPILGVFGNEPKTFVSPWRFLDVLAITYLALTSTGLSRIAVLRPLRSVVACGRNSLHVFAFGCIVALVARVVFKTFDVTVLTQIIVNLAGLGSILWVGSALDAARAGRNARRQKSVQRDRERLAH